MNLADYPFFHLLEIEKKIGYKFQDSSLLVLAFVHRSFINEHRSLTEHNERLEFLGDAVLGGIVSEFLYQRFPLISEGELSYLRSRLVEANSCVNYLQQLNIASYLLLGKGEQMNGGRGRESILADLFEALIGAIYLDGGIAAAKTFFLGLFSLQIEKILKTPLCNWKALLQDYCQKKFHSPPVYQVLNESGPDHDKVFEVAVLIDNQEISRGRGSSKKEAQQAAAASFVKQLKNNSSFTSL